MRTLSWTARLACAQTLWSVRKSALAAPILRATSESTRPSADKDAPRYTMDSLCLTSAPSRVRIFFHPDRKRIRRHERSAAAHDHGDAQHKICVPNRTHIVTARTHPGAPRGAHQAIPSLRWLRRPRDAAGGERHPGPIQPLRTR